MENNRYLQYATWILRLIGVSVCFAFFPIFFPLHWMEWIHSAIGLREMPRQPIFEYLTRSLSAMYFAHGCLVMFISSDVARYLPLAKAVAILNIFLGGVLLCVDLRAPMPWYWTACEGPPIVAVGGVLLFCCSRIERS